MELLVYSTSIFLLYLITLVSECTPEHLCARLKQYGGKSVVLGPSPKKTTVPYGIFFIRYCYA